MAVSFLLYGIYATFSLIAFYFLLTRDVNKKARLTLLAVISFMFLNSTTSIVLSLEYILVQIPLLSFHPPNPAKLLGDMKITLNFLERVNYVINDSIVVWRAWILFPHNRLVKVVLGICLLACYVGNIYDAASGAVNVLRSFHAIGAGTNEFLVLTLPLLITNVVATSLVGYKAFRHRQDIRRNLHTSSNGPRGSITKTQKILLLLVESGCVYIAIWIASTFLTKDSGKISFQVFSGSAVPYLSALYPVIIILLAALENSKDQNNFTLSQSIRFAEANPNASTSDLSESLDNDNRDVNVEIVYAHGAKESV
ncbi:hypothetical protein BDP27DRAFT_1337586 [Rhodocollybia butyracea]|uniref:Uncharacterized protein n=1 Tax=Rhodocollybia butyracea TaxID=206335 RepID=A0A9P5TZR1_9AGAR|nr:hypothetical protein BDP27DRAFT_1337586 [Rhodocollybia butyracea]